MDRRRRDGRRHRCSAIAVALLIPAPARRGRATRSTAIRPRSGDDLDGDAGGVLLVALARRWCHVIVWYPAEILDAAAGYVFGFGVGVPADDGASWLGLRALPPTPSAATPARPVLYRLAGEERFQRMERLIHRGGVTLPADAARLIPIVPFSLIGLRLPAPPASPLSASPGRRLVGYIADHRLLHLRRQQARELLGRGPHPLDRRRRRSCSPSSVRYWSRLRGPSAGDGAEAED